MKREVLCQSCASKPVAQDLSYEVLLRRVVTPPDQTKRVYGKSLRHMLCDSCNGKISIMDDIVCVSTWNSGVYFSWENDYLEVSR